MHSDLPISVRFDASSDASPVYSPLFFRQLDQIQDHLSHLTTLTMGPVAGSRFMAVDICMFFLHTRMPALRELTIRATYAADRAVTSAQVPRPTITWDNLPSLRTLVLDGVGLPTSGTLGHKLSHLELRNYPSEESQLRFHELLEVFAFCAAIEEIRIHNYLKVTDLEVVWQSEPSILAHLERLVIHDSPAHMSHLLSYLHLPRIVVAQLSTHFPKFMIDGGRVIPMLPAMLPPSQHALNMTSLHPEQIRVNINPTGMIVTGVAANNRRTCFDGIANLSDPSIRVQTYARTVESLGSIFSTTNVTKLVITGDFSSSVTNAGLYVYDTTVTSAIPPSFNGAMYLVGSASSNDQRSSSVVTSSRPLIPNWLAVLSHFPAVRTLCIQDQGGATPPESFAIALAGTPTLVCCPHLEGLRLEGVSYDKSFFRQLAQTLTGRSQRCWPLKDLTVTLSNSARRSIVEDLRKMFLDYADVFKLDYA